MTTGRSGERREVLVTSGVALTLLAIVALLAGAGRVPTGDGPHLAATTFEIADALRAGDLATAFGTWFTRVSPQPPAGYAPGVLAALFLGDRWIAPLLTGAFALGLVWNALRRLADNALPWAPALVIVANPICWLYVEQYGWDLLTGAAVLQAISWLHASRGLRDIPAARRFGLWMGLGFLTKYTFPMFLWLPCLWAGVGILRGPDRGARLATLGQAVGIFMLLVAPWMVVNHSELFAYLGRSVGSDAVAAVEASRAGANRFTAASLALYPLALKDALGWPGALALAGVAVGSVFFGGGGGPPQRPPRAETPGTAVAALAAFGGLAVLSVLEQSQDRYALPALLALAALAQPLARLPWGLEVFVGVFGIQLLGTVATFRPGAPTYTPRFDHDLASATAMSWPVSRSYLPTHVDLDAWRIDEALTRLAGFTGDAPAALVLPDDPRFPEPGLYLLRARQLDLPLTLRIARPRGASAPRDGWPARDIGAVYTIWTPGVDTATEAWMAGSGRVALAEIALPRPLNGAVLR